MFTETLAEYELEPGKPISSKHHSRVQRNLLIQMHLRYQERYDVFPEVSLGLPILDRVPDLAIYTSMEYGEEEIKMTQLPLCSVEILSPVQNRIGIKDTRRQYFDAGVQSYWLVIPALKSAYVFSSPNEFEVYSYRETLIDPKLGIELPLSEVFK